MLPFAALVLGAAFWGGTWPVAKVVWNDFTPGGMAFWRWITAFLAMLPFGLPGLLRGLAAIRQEVWRLLFLAACGLTAFNLLIFHGLETTTAINGALINGATPIYIMLLGFIGIGERGTWRQIAGILVALPGLVLVVTYGEPGRLLRLELVPGDLLVAAGMFGWALYNIFIRKWPTALPPIAFMCVLSLFAALMLLPFWIWEMAQGDFIRWSGEAIGGAVYLGVFASFGSYVVWNFGLRQTGAATASLFQYLIPVFAALFAVVFVGERLHWYHIAGLALIVAGIYLSNSGRRAPRGQPPGKREQETP